VLEVLADVPGFDQSAHAAKDLLMLQQQGVHLLRTGLMQVQPHLADLQADSFASPGEQPTLPALIAATGGDIAALAPDFQNLADQATKAAAYASFDSALAGRLEQLVLSARLGTALATLGPHLDWLLGMQAPRTFLVLAQNNDELRATGGFISAGGTITLDKGRVTVNDLVDSYAIYRDDVDHPPAPAALQKYMQAYILLLRDANWSPDAPTSARAAADLYKLETGNDVDGVILLDTSAVAHLVRALGPITLDGRGVTLSADDLEQQLIAFWDPEIVPASADFVAAAVPGAAVSPPGWWEQRKDFIPEVAQAVLAQAQSSGDSTLALAGALLDALDDRSLQIWVEDAAAAGALNQRGWDGALEPQEGADFLAVVDSNVGFNKVDAVITRSLAYNVDWPDVVDATDPPAPTAVLTLNYTHTLSASDPGCDQTPRYGNSYADLTARCYFDYVRVYAPPGSRLLSSHGFQPDSTTSEVGEKGLQVFGGFFVQPPGTTHTVTLTYTLPASIQPDGYALMLQRQAGVNPLPVALRVGSSNVAVELSRSRLEWQPEYTN
jgi:hypothetical protein